MEKVLVWLSDNIPVVTGDSGEVIGVEFAASGDDASIALTTAIAEIVDHLRMDL